MTVKFKVIKNDGEIKTIKRSVEKFGFIGSNVKNAMEYLDNLDKTDFMDENDIYIILNYKVTQDSKDVTIKVPFTQYAIEFVNDWDKTRIGNFFLIYKRLKDSISHLPNEKQIRITLAAYSVALDSKIAAYDHMIKYEKELEEHIKHLSIDEIKQLSALNETKD